MPAWRIRNPQLQPSSSNCSQIFCNRSRASPIAAGYLVLQRRSAAIADTLIFLAAYFSNTTCNWAGELHGGFANLQLQPSVLLRRVRSRLAVAAPHLSRTRPRGPWRPNRTAPVKSCGHAADRGGHWCSHVHVLSLSLPLLGRVDLLICAVLRRSLKSGLTELLVAQVREAKHDKQEARLPHVSELLL